MQPKRGDDLTIFYLRQPGCSFTELILSDPNTVFWREPSLVAGKYDVPIQN